MATREEIKKALRAGEPDMDNPTHRQDAYPTVGAKTPAKK